MRDSRPELSISSICSIIGSNHYGIQNGFRDALKSWLPNKKHLLPKKFASQTYTQILESISPIELDEFLEKLERIK